MNMDNPFEAQSGTQLLGIGRTLSQNVVLGKTICEEKMIEQSLTPEHLSRSFPAACPSIDAGLLDKELEYLWEDGGAAGKSYEVYLGKISRNPIVKSKISGKSFVLPRPVIIKLAATKGLVGVGRALLADAGWARKIREGRFSELTGFTKEALATLA